MCGVLGPRPAEQISSASQFAIAPVRHGPIFEKSADFANEAPSFLAAHFLQLIRLRLNVFGSVRGVSFLMGKFLIGKNARIHFGSIDRSDSEASVIFRHPRRDSYTLL